MRPLDWIAETDELGLFQWARHKHLRFRIQNHEHGAFMLKVFAFGVEVRQCVFQSLREAQNDADKVAEAIS